MRTNDGYNGSGYFDPTMSAAIESDNKARKRVNRLLKTIFSICDIAGFKIDGRITLVDKETGEIWR